MALTVSWMNRKLGRGHGENEPASACVDRRHAEYVGKERADLLRFSREHDGMHSGDHAAILAAGSRSSRYAQPSASDPNVRASQGRVPNEGLPGLAGSVA
jgi:hypothetical protein